MQPEQPTDQPTPQFEQASEASVEQSTATPDAQPIQWQAPEYVQERRSPWWFIGFWLVAILLMIIAIFVIRSITFAILIPAMAAALMIYSHRPPRMLNYVLSSKGVYINEKLHPLSEFRSFGIMHEESIPSLMLLPVQRFRPGLTLHFPAEVGEAIVDMLGNRIPMQDITLDVFDRIIRKLHI